MPQNSDQNTDTNTPTQSRAQEMGIPDEVSRVMDFDLFEPSQVEGEPDASRQSEGQDDSKSQRAQGGRKPAGESQVAESDDLPDNKQTQTDDSQTKADPVVGRLDDIASLLRVQAQTAQQPKKADEPAKPRFNLDIPQPIISALSSEDPNERAQGFNALVNGIANTIGVELKKDFDERLAQERQQLQQGWTQQQRIEAAQQHMRNEFYGEYPTIPRNEMMEGLIAATAQRLALQKGQAYKWDAAFRKELVETVYSTLGMQAPAVQSRAPAQNQTQTQRPIRQPAKPQFATGANGGGGGKATAPSPEIQDIWDTLGFNTEPN